MQVNNECWRTPPEVFEPLNAEFKFDLDAAADDSNFLADRYITEFQDALKVADWAGKRIWLNPPYGRKLEPFVRRAADEADKGKTIVALIPFRCRAAWWHESVLGRASEVRCVRKRIRFVRPDVTRGKSVGACDSCIVVWRGGSAETKLVGFEPLSPVVHRVMGKFKEHLASIANRIES
jgi:phage N-6-adenine-methyltransferase